MSDGSSVSQSAVAPPTSPTSSAAPIGISSPDEVMEQLLHHQLEELESSHRHDDVTQDDTGDITMHMCGHIRSSLSSVDSSAPADIVQGKKEEEEVGSDELVGSKETKPAPPLKGETINLLLVQRSRSNDTCTCAVY